MCVYSMIADHYIGKWQPQPIVIPVVPAQPYPLTMEEIEELRKLLQRAKKYDEEHKEPECELEGKKRKLKELAKELLGIEIALP